MPHLSQLLERSLITLCDGVGTPRALTIKLLVSNSEWDQLFSLKIDPRHYNDSESYFRDACITDFIRKLELKIPGRDLKSEAVKQFFDCETQNCSSNVRLSRFTSNGPFGNGDMSILPILGRMRKIVADILGKLPDELDLKFGPGATFEDRGRLCTVPDKMSSRPTITAGARCLLPFWERSSWARSNYRTLLASDPKTVRGNRFTTVPKDSLKRRGICIESSINVGLQLSVGTLIRRRLRRHGIDITTAQMKHREVVRDASVTGDYSSIDLSNASDTICVEMVRLLLPKEWFDLLYSLRSPMTNVNGKWVYLEKFSSMGNGYTFELETLLFSAISLAISQEVDLSYPTLGYGVWVYGDDIIVPTIAAPHVISCLSWFGLKTNPKKTFIDGPFRESCGGDYFDGVDVRPHLQDSDPDEPQKVIALLNGIRRMYSEIPSRKSYLLRVWFDILNSLPSELRRLRGPCSLGDLVIHDDHGWCFRELKDGRGFIRTYSPVIPLLKWEHWKPSVILASALYGISSGSSWFSKTSSDGQPFIWLTAGGVSERGIISGYRLKWTSCLEREVNPVTGYQ